jgi:hypothetical protein
MSDKDKQDCCFVCGEGCDIYPDPPERGTCYEHCPDHDYQVFDGERRCQHCNAPVPFDYYDD